MARLPAEFSALKGQTVTVCVYDRVSTLGYQVEHRTGVVRHVWRREGAPFVSVEIDGRRLSCALADVVRWNDLCEEPGRPARMATLDIDVPGDVNATGALLQARAASVADLVQILADDAALMSPDYDEGAPPTNGQLWEFARAAWAHGRASRVWHGCTFALHTVAD